MMQTHLKKFVRNWEKLWKCKISTVIEPTMWLNLHSLLGCSEGGLLFSTTKEIDLLLLELLFWIINLQIVGILMHFETLLNILATLSMQTFDKIKIDKHTYTTYTYNFVLHVVHLGWGACTCWSNVLVLARFSVHTDTWLTAHLVPCGWIWMLALPLRTLSFSFRNTAIFGPWHWRAVGNPIYM